MRDYGYVEFVFNRNESFLQNLARLEVHEWAMRGWSRKEREDFIRTWLFGTTHYLPCFIVRVACLGAKRMTRCKRCGESQDARQHRRGFVQFTHDHEPEYRREHEAPSAAGWCETIHRQIVKNLEHAAIHGLPPEKKMDNILTKAAATVDSNRQSEYGDPVENWVATALIATITQRKPITPEDVIQVMTAQKSVRAGRSHKEDTNIDQAGYAEIRERVQKAWKDGTVQKIVEKLLGGWVKFPTAPNTVTGVVSSVEVRMPRSDFHDWGVQPWVEVTVRVPYGTFQPRPGDNLSIVMK